MQKYIILFSLLFFGLHLRAQQTIFSGIITDPGGQPVSGAHVLLLPEKEVKVTADAGTFQFGEFSPGAARIRVGSSGYETLDTTLVIHAGMNRGVFQLKPFAVDLNAVVVTATRSARPLKAVPIHTQVVYAESLEKLGVGDFSEALTTFFPGLDVSGASAGSGGSGLVMGGLGAKYVLILLNGERMNAGDTKERVDLNRINTANIERIEIVRGASSSLYGTDAIGGVINIITKSAKQAFEGAVGSRISDYNERRDYAHVGVKKSTWRFDTSVKREQTDGYDLHPDEAGKTVEESTNYNFSQKVGVTLSPNVDLSGEVNYFKREDTNTTPYLPDRDYEDWRYLLTGKVNFNENHRLEMVLYRDDYQSTDLDTPEIGMESRHYEKQFQSVRLQDNLKLSQTNSLVLGVEYTHEKLFSANGLDSTKRAEGAILFAQDVWDLATDLSVVAGGRVTKHSEYDWNSTLQLAVNYRPGDFSFRAGYGRGFRAPTLKELYLDFQVPGAPIRVVGNADLKPETSDFYSLSAEYHVPKWSGSVIGQYNRLQQLITEIYQPGTFPMRYQYQNVEAVEILNVDVMMAYNPVRGLRLSGGYSFSKPFGQDDLEASTFVSSRRHTGSLTLEYGRLRGKYRPSVALQGRYLGEKSIVWTDDHGNDEAVDLSDYSLWKLTTVHQFNRWFSVTLGIANLFDAKDPDYYNNMSPGRRYFAGVDLRW